MSNKTGKETPALVRFFNRLDSIVIPIENILSAVAFGLMCLVVLYGVVCRYIFRYPNPYGEEISRYLMIFAVYLGVAVAVRKKEHIRVDFLIRILPGNIGKVVEIFGEIVTFFGYVLLFLLSNRMFTKMMSTMQKTPSLRIPMYTIYLALVIGFALAVIHCAENFILDHFVKYDAEKEGHK